MSSMLHMSQHHSEDWTVKYIEPSIILQLTKVVLVVTDAEVRAFLEKFFVPQNMIMIFVGPKDHIIDILNKHWPEVDIRVHDIKELIE